MNNSGRVIGLIVSILFAVGAVVFGGIYDSKRASELNLVTPTKVSVSETKDQVADTKQTSSTLPKEEEGSNEVENITEAEKKAQELIDLIIIEGQVQQNFTLDDYKRAKEAVDALPETVSKTAFIEQIEQIETALTNMGIAF